MPGSSDSIAFSIPGSSIDTVLMSITMMSRHSLVGQLPAVVSCSDWRHGLREVGLLSHCRVNDVTSCPIEIVSNLLYAERITWDSAAVQCTLWQASDAEGGPTMLGSWRLIVAAYDCLFKSSIYLNYKRIRMLDWHGKRLLYRIFI